MALIEERLERAPNFREVELVLAGCPDDMIVDYTAGILAGPKVRYSENLLISNALQDLNVQLMTRFPWVMGYPEVADPTLDPWDYAVEFIKILERN